MINLLPLEDKRQITAARANSLLFRYTLFSVGVLAFLLAAIAITYIYLTNVKAGAEQTIEQSKARVSDYANVQMEADQFRAKLATAQQILDREVTYTKVALQIAQLLPAGVILKNLDLDAQTFGAPTTISVQARSYAAATELKDSFQASTLFSDVHFQSITSSADAGGYPFTVVLGVTIQKGAATQ